MSRFAQNGQVSPVCPKTPDLRPMLYPKEASQYYFENLEIPKLPSIQGLHRKMSSNEAAAKSPILNFLKKRGQRKGGYLKNIDNLIQ